MSAAPLSPDPVPPPTDVVADIRPVAERDDGAGDREQVEQELALAAAPGVGPSGLAWMGRRSAAWAAAVLLAVGILGGVAGAALTQRSAASSRPGADLAQVALDAATSPASHSVQMQANNVVLAQLVVLPDGGGYLVPKDLPVLGPDRTYQLWGQNGAKLVSLAVIGPRPAVTAFRVPTPAIDVLVLSNEPQPGSVAPTQPVATAQL